MGGRIAVGRMGRRRRKIKVEVEGCPFHVSFVHQVHCVAFVV